MLQKETRCIKSWGVKTFEQDVDVQYFSYFVEISFFFNLVLPFRSNRRYLDVSRKKKISAIYLDLQIQKVITPCLLMHCVSYEIENWVKGSELVYGFADLVCGSGVWVSGFRNCVTSKDFVCKRLKIKVIKFAYCD